MLLCKINHFKVKNVSRNKSNERKYCLTPTTQDVSPSLARYTPNPQVSRSGFGTCL